MYPIKSCIHKKPMSSKPSEPLVLPKILNPKSYHQNVELSNKLSNYHQNFELSNHQQSHKETKIHQNPSKLPNAKWDR